MKLGYSTWGMPTVPIDTAISHLANLGYDGVELTIIPRFTTELSTLDATERKRIASLLKEHNLALPAIAAHSRSVGNGSRQTRPKYVAVERRCRFGSRNSHKATHRRQ